MKKLFFFRSSSNNGNSSTSSPKSADRQVYWEMPPDCGLNNQSATEKTSRSPKGLFSKSRKQVHDSESSNTSSALRRSRSLSSATFLGDGLGQSNVMKVDNSNRSPSSSTSSTSRHKYDHWSRSLDKTMQFEIPTVQDVHGLETERPDSSKSHCDLSGNTSSSNSSNKVLDLYIDGEHQQERNKPKNSYSMRNFTGPGNAGGRLPPRVQYTAPTSPIDCVKDKSRCHSFREANGARLNFSSRDLMENGFGHESPRRLAKNVIERLSQTHAFPKSVLKEFDCDIPITVEDIYGGSTNRCFYPNSDVPSLKSYSLEEPYETSGGYHGDDVSGSKKQTNFFGDSFGDTNSVQIEDVDMELQLRFKEAEERVALLSEELEQDSFYQDRRLDISSLLRIIGILREDKMRLAIEVSGILKSRIAERDYAKEELESVKAELESRTRRLEKEKNELQSSLEKELDRRSSDWSIKLDKYQVEEQRLRERVRELAEQNVALQREVSSFNDREAENRSAITYSEQQLRCLTSRVEELSEENENIKRNLDELQEKYTASEENLDCIKRNFEEKDVECKELQKSITRLLRTCSEQERTIRGLREGFSEEIEKQQLLGKFDKHVAKLQTEQMRLTGVELTLRREVELHRLEVDSLRHENIDLLNRLKNSGKEHDAITFKLDKEMWTRVCCLQNLGLSMLNEGTLLCGKLLEYNKIKAGQIQETKQGLELLKNGLDEQFFVDSDVKILGLKRGTENLTRSLQAISSLLQEKSNLVAQSQSLCNNAEESQKQNHHQTQEEFIRFELKVETLLTGLLREKLYSKELEVEHVQAELAAAVRGNDILRCEAQNALDNLSCLSHKLKDMKLQILKKEESMSRLQSDLQESSKELMITRGVLPKVSEERDMMWEEVKQHKEKNMLLNSEVDTLRKKVEALEEDMLLKEGQITILKDTLQNRPFGLLASPESMQEFLLE